MFINHGIMSNTIAPNPNPAAAATATHADLPDTRNAYNNSQLTSIICPNITRQISHVQADESAVAESIIHTLPPPHPLAPVPTEHDRNHAPGIPDRRKSVRPVASNRGKFLRAARLSGTVNMVEEEAETKGAEKEEEVVTPDEATVCDRMGFCEGIVEILGGLLTRAT
jgi:hypothetical protein